jgi:hypothetical protein
MGSKKGFSYSYDEEKINAYASLAAKEKLEWLYEANQFSKKAIKGKTFVIGSEEYKQISGKLFAQERFES